MKKFTALLLLSITLLACKKETKTVTKIDPKTGKTVTVEVPVEKAEEDSLAMAKEMAAKAAIKDSAGVYKQIFVLEKGKTYPFTTFQKNNITIAAPNNQKQNMTTESTDVVSFTVNDLKDDVYDITINFVSKKTSQSAEGKSVTIDTKAAAPKEESLKNKWVLDKALTGNNLTMKMNKNGKIISINGFDAIYKKLGSTINTLTKDPAIRKGLLEQSKQSFNEKILKDQFSKNMLVLPAKGVKIGEKWSNTENATPDGKVKLTTNYVLKSVQNGVAEISVTGGLPKQSDKNSQNGITHSMSSELNQNGSMKFDVMSGWIKNQNIKVTTIQKETYSDGKKSETVTNTTHTNVVVNP